MSVIFHVLKEEFERLQETEDSYINAIAKMPRGNSRIQQRCNNMYLYLQYRDGKKVIHEYIGAQDSEKAKDVLEKVAQRKRYEKLLKETKTAQRNKSCT